MKGKKPAKSVTLARNKPVTKRNKTTELQNIAIRMTVNNPGISYTDIGKHLHLNRVVVSRWFHHDPDFIEALEKAQSAPRERLTADEFLDRLLPGEREKLVALMGAQSGGGREPHRPIRLNKLRHYAMGLTEPGKREAMILALDELLGDLMVHWRKAKGTWPTAVARGLLAMRKETAQILENAEVYQWSQGDRENPFEPSDDIRDEKLVLDHENRVLDLMERGADPGDPWDEDAPPGDEDSNGGE